MTLLLLIGTLHHIASLKLFSGRCPITLGTVKLEGVTVDLREISI